MRMLCRTLKEVVLRMHICVLVASCVDTFNDLLSSVINSQFAIDNMMFNT